MYNEHWMPVNEVSKSVRQMIKDKYALSSGSYNSLNFYTHDKYHVISLSQYHDDSKRSKDEHLLTVSNIHDISSVKINTDTFNDILLTLARYNEVVAPAKKELSKVSIEEVRNLFTAYKYLGNQAVVSLLCKYLIEHDCPKDFINRTYYFLDKTNQRTKKQIEEDNALFGHDNKLIRYETPSKNLWFFVGEQGTHPFSPMNKRIESLFNMVEKSYRKQK